MSQLPFDEERWHENMRDLIRILLLSFAIALLTFIHSFDFFSSLLSSNHQRKHSLWFPEQSHSQKPETIFVLIASYRDPLCSRTVQNAFARASDPSRLFLGIVDQKATDELTCLPPNWKRDENRSKVCSKPLCPQQDQIRLLEEPFDKAEGPVPTRYMASQLYRNETYVLIIDSHMQFTPGWDQLLVKQYRELPTYPSVLSHYPLPWRPFAKPPHDISHQHGRTKIMAGCRFNTEGFCEPQSVMTTLARAHLSPHIAGGFLFGSAQFLREVPLDPHLAFLFVGEEPWYSTRLWTAGWDIYAPVKPVCFHYYGRHEAHRFFELEGDGRAEQREFSVKRVQYLMQLLQKGSLEPFVSVASVENNSSVPWGWNLSIDAHLYGAGQVRRLEDYIIFAGYDFSNYKEVTQWHYQWPI